MVSETNRALLVVILFWINKLERQQGICCIRDLLSSNFDLRHKVLAYLLAFTIYRRGCTLLETDEDLSFHAYGSTYEYMHIRILHVRNTQRD
jgi:hypothetical protein